MNHRKHAKELKPTVFIGKEGVTPSVIEEIKRQVKARKLVKVRVAKHLLDDRKRFAQDLADRTGTELVDRIGFVIVLRSRTA